MAFSTLYEELNVSGKMDMVAPEKPKAYPSAVCGSLKLTEASLFSSGGWQTGAP